jgi:DNA-binding response OmpR family regulator
MEPATILVVERDILVRQPLAQYLRDCGYRVLEAVNAAEARGAVSTGRESIDVVLMDVKGVPSEGGFPTIRLSRFCSAALLLKSCNWQATCVMTRPKVA